MWEDAPYLTTGKETHIKVLSKKDKDPLMPSSHRPISLIIIDAKLLKTIITNRIPILLSPIDTL